MSKLHITGATKKKIGRFELGVVSGTIPDDNNERVKTIMFSFNQYRLASFMFVSDGWRKNNGKYHILGVKDYVIFTRYVAINLKPKKLKKKSN